MSSSSLLCQKKIYSILSLPGLKTSGHNRWTILYSSFKTTIYTVHKATAARLAGDRLESSVNIETAAQVADNWQERLVNIEQTGQGK